MFEEFYDVVANVSRTVRHYESQFSRPVIGVLPAYFPLELIWAAGGYPVQLWGNNLPLENSDTYLQSYCCSVAHSVLELELRGSAKMVQAYAFTSLCDTLINLREIYRRLFDKPTVELSIPITQTDQARKSYLASVLDTVIKDLQKITGQAINAQSLAEAAQLYGRCRALQRRLYELRRQNPALMTNRDFYIVIKAGFFLPPSIYQSMLEGLLAGIEKNHVPDWQRQRLFVSGMLFDPIEICSILDELEVDIVDDDFANGWRSVSKGVLNVDNLIDGVAEYLFRSAPCCCVYNPDNDRHAYILQRMKDCRAQGVLFWYVKFCEPDAFDRPQLSKHIKQQGFPVITVEVELSMRNFEALKTRINAFCEMLEQ